MPGDGCGAGGGGVVGGVGVFCFHACSSEAQDKVKFMPSSDCGWADCEAARELGP